MFVSYFSVIFSAKFLNSNPCMTSDFSNAIFCFVAHDIISILSEIGLV